MMPVYCEVTTKKGQNEVGSLPKWHRREYFGLIEQ